MDKKKASRLMTPGIRGGRSGASSRLSGYSTNRSHVHSSLGLNSFGTSSKTSLSSVSKKNLASESTSKITEPLIVEDGVDLTPRNLLPQSKATGKKRGSRPKSERNDSAFQTSIYGSGLGTTSFNQAFSQQTLTLTGSVLEPSRGISGFASTTATPSPPRVTPVHEPVEDRRPLVVASVTLFSSEELEKEITLSLKETETMWMFGLPSLWVDPGSSDAAEVIEANQRYKQSLESRAGNDNFSSRAMQTFNNPRKTKEIQTEDVFTQEIAVNVSTADIYDTYQELEDERRRYEDNEDDFLAKFTATKSKSSQVQSSTEPFSDSTVISDPRESTKSSVMLGSTTMDLSVLDTGLGAGAETKSSATVVSIDPTIPNNHPIMTHPNLMDSLRLMERAILQNIYHGKQTQYRNMIPLRDPNCPPPTKADRITISAPHLDKLWSYGCSLTHKLKVTCMAWNKSNEDILAVGYGSFSDRDHCDGVVCCWSIKNPEYPERVFFANAGISALDFSKDHPSLLAAGLLNGSVLLYDIRSTKHDPVLDSREALYKHLAPVWCLTWVMKEGSLTEGRYAECLISISMDGNVLEWSIQKGFESCQLMHLKRLITKKEKKAKAKAQLLKAKKGGPHSRNPRNKKQQPPKPEISIGQTYISQHAPGMALAFWPKDTNVYLACTEEGHVHKCSCSYNEQFLDTYEGHTGPVYGVTWSPYMDDYFLTCSADWSVKLWHQEKTTPIHSFSSAPKVINNVCWSPFNATMFGYVSQGRVEIWDLHHTYLDPTIVHKPLGAANQTCISFAPNTKIVLVGDSEGEVSVYMLRNLPSMQEDQKDAFQNVVKTMLKRGPN